MHNVVLPFNDTILARVLARTYQSERVWL